MYYGNYYGSCPHCQPRCPCCGRPLNQPYYWNQVYCGTLGSAQMQATSAGLGSAQMQATQTSACNCGGTATTGTVSA